MNRTLIAAAMAASAACWAGAGEGLTYDVKVIRKNIEERRARAQIQALHSLRTSLIAEMSGILKDRDAKGDLKADAATVLGELRASEAVPLLCDNLMVRPAILFDRSLAGTWPAQNALILIGKPASREITMRLRLKQEDSQLQVLCTILVQIEGYDVAKFLLERELESHPRNVAEVSHDNLKAALVRIEAIHMENQDKNRGKSPGGVAPDSGRTTDGQDSQVSAPAPAPVPASENPE